ncbi:hypothetical protein B0H14DRAFT_2994827 [Mycena olivaceomarginata]|nr:hypothetical protein B0H14DRAFT_2994827 [Mycena olivaceomarginata]
MDIDEEPALVAASPPSPRKPVSEPSNAAKATNPLNNIHNSPPSRPTQNLPSSPSPSSHHIGTIAASIARPASPKENDPLRNEAASDLARPSTSTAKQPDHASVSVVSVLEPQKARRSSESVPPADSAAASPEPEKQLTKKQKKNLNKRAKKAKFKQQKTDDSQPAVSAVVVPQTSTAIVPRNAAPVHTEPTTPAGPAISSTITAAAHSPQNRQPSLPAAIDLVPPDGFTRISKLDGTRWNVYSIMGIVTSVTPAAKTSNDWKCSLRIVDTSNCDESYRPAKEGLSVNCFMKDRNWLPAAKPGDAILLHDIKASTLNGNTVAVGFSDKLQWAVYDPATKKIGHGGSPHATESISLAEGYGAKFTSFFHGATEADLKYCVALDEWWREVEAKRLAALGTIHQIGAEISSTSFRSSGSKREHRLISDLSVDRIGQYFDCTVRVIHGHPNGRTHRLYVTDGTPLQGGRPCQISECPPSLVDCIMTIEMWDAACLQGPTILPNEYYLLKNVRFMRGYDGYAEAKLVEDKIQKLEVDAADDYPNLKALLERLKLHDKDVEDPDRDLKLIKQAQDRQFMNCVVELLHIDESQHTIYVTDYTSHPKMTTIKESWARGLDGHILKIALFNEQRAMTQHLGVGQYYTILQLRVQTSSTAREFRGTLGGSQRLILPVNPKSSSVESWKQDLIERKNKLNHPESQIEPPAQVVSDIPPRRVDGSAVQKRNYRSIKQVLESTECPQMFLVRARVVEFFPFQLKDSFKRTCTKCNTLISDKRLACPRCDDVEKKYVKIVSIFRVEINDGEETLQISVPDNIPLLKGMKPTILHDDPEAARQFASLTKPLLNNLEAVHDGKLTGQNVELEGSELTLKIVYGLRHYEP